MLCSHIKKQLQDHKQKWEETINEEKNSLRENDTWKEIDKET